MVKICPKCLEVWPGGYRCEICGGPLTHTDEEAARKLPESVWKNQRIDYGARRGMIVRFLGIFAGFVVAVIGVRESIPQASPWSLILALASIGAGVAVWGIVYHLAGRGVRIWVLRKGQLQKRKLARALLGQAQLGGKRSSS